VESPQPAQFRLTLRNPQTAHSERTLVVFSCSGIVEEDESELLSRSESDGASSLRFASSWRLTLSMASPAHCSWI
jgi:hypothetical protein